MPSGTTDAVDGDAGPSLPVGPVAYRVGSDGTTEPVPRAPARRPGVHPAPADPATPAGPAPMAAAPSPDPGSPPGAAPVPAAEVPVPAGFPVRPRRSRAAGVRGRGVVGIGGRVGTGRRRMAGGVRRRGPGRAARPGRLGHRADRRRPAQGLRPRRPGHHPDHLDDRLAPAAGGRPGTPSSSCAGWTAPAGSGPEPARQPLAPRRLAPGRHRGLLLRRRLGQPRHRHRRVQHRRLVRPHRPAAAGAASSARTTASGISVRSPDGWVERDAAQPARAALLHAPTAATWPPTYDAGGRGRRLGTPATGARPCCTCDGPADGARRRRRRGRLPQPGRDRRRPGPRPAGRHRPAARRGRPGHRRGAARPATTRSAGRSAGWPRRCSPSRSWPPRPRWSPRWPRAGRCGSPGP